MDRKRTVSNAISDLEKIWQWVNQGNRTHKNDKKEL